MPSKQKQWKESTQISKSLSLAKTTGNVSQSNYQCDQTLPYISEVHKVGIMREIYKQQTKEYVNQKLHHLLGTDMERRLQTVQNMQQLVNYDKGLLQQLNKQRTIIGEDISKILQVSHTIFKNLKSAPEATQLNQAEKSIQELLSQENQ